MNRIFHNSHFKRNVSLEEQEAPDLFAIALRNDDIQGFASK